jgi:hypothetical protein
VLVEEVDEGRLPAGHSGAIFRFDAVVRGTVKAFEQEAGDVQNVLHDFLSSSRAFSPAEVMT